MARTRTATHSASYDREAILARLMASTPESPTPQVRQQRVNDGTVSWNQAITVKACADALGDTFAWIDKPRKGRYVIGMNGATLTPEQVSTIISAWKARPR